jgi:hypothetical protein
MGSAIVSDMKRMRRGAWNKRLGEEKGEVERRGMKGS